MKPIRATFCAGDEGVVSTFAAGGYDMTGLTVFLDTVQANVSPAPTVVPLTCTVVAKLAAPGIPVLSAVPGGFWPAQTIYTKISYLNQFGYETLASAEASLSAGANTLLSVASPSPLTGATSYNVYAATVSGEEVLQNAIPIPIGVAWTMPTSGLITGPLFPPAQGVVGAFPPATNGTSTCTYGPSTGTEWTVGDAPYTFQLRVTNGSGVVLRTPEPWTVFIPLRVT